MMLWLVNVKHSIVFNIFIQFFYIFYSKHLIKLNLLKELKLILEVFV